MLTLTPEEFLAGIAGITSFEALGIPNYTQPQWKVLPPLTRISETLRIRGEGETLDTQVSDPDWQNELAWDTEHTQCFNTFKRLTAKGYTFREYLEQIWITKFGDNGFEQYIAHASRMAYREPYFTNNFEPNLRDVWNGKTLRHSSCGPQLTALVDDFKKKTGWSVLPRIQAVQWEKDRALYPLCILHWRKGFRLSR